MRRSFLRAGCLAAMLGTLALANEPEAFAAFQRQEIERWRDVVQKKGLTPE